MAINTAAPTNSSASQSPTKSKRTSKKRKKQRQIVCRICHKHFPSITAEHLRTHGFTITRYRRAFGSLTRATATQPVATGRVADRQTVASLADRIVHDPEVIRELAGEVSEAIFGSSLRDALRLSLVSVITERLRAHGEATAALAQVRKELSAEWRTTQGGPNGAPTPTKDLLGMASVLNQEVRSGEELLLKTVKLALEEQRTYKGSGMVEGGLPDRFTGEGEHLPVPAELTSQDRETIRTLWGMFDRAVTAQRSLTVDVTPTSTVRPAGDLSAKLKAPAESAEPTADASAGRPPAEAAEPLLSPEDNGLIPLQAEDEPY